MKTKEFYKTTKRRFSVVPFLFLMGVLVFASCDDDDDEAMIQPVEKNVVEVAAEAGTFNVLIEAATKAGLADFLSTEQNITVFAPTDAAFAALLTDLGVSSLDEIDAATLASVLTYHVVSGKVYSNNSSNPQLYKMRQA